MNIVFWLIVVIVLVLIWFCLSFAFKGVGGVGMRLYNDAKSVLKSMPSWIPICVRSSTSMASLLTL